MAKAELFKNWFMGPLARAYHAFPVIRHSPDRNALRRAFSLLKGGKAVVLFPEGTRSENAQLHRAEPGAGFVARHSGAPIVPMALTGSHKVLGRSQVFPRRAPVEMSFGQPFSLPERNPDGSVMEHQQSADFMMMKIAELLPLEYQGEYRQPGPSRSEAV
jgi:1-acyl-sn-glycerol-3-phosphate acyltransferase